MVKGFKGKGLGKDTQDTIGDWFKDKELCEEIEELSS